LWLEFNDLNPSNTVADSSEFGNHMQRGSAAGSPDATDPKFISQGRGIYFDGTTWLELYGIDIHYETAFSSAFWLCYTIDGS
jgi:hypothetical protein